MQSVGDVDCRFVCSNEVINFYTNAIRKGRLEIKEQSLLCARGKLVLIRSAVFDFCAEEKTIVETSTFQDLQN